MSTAVINDSELLAAAREIGPLLDREGEAGEAQGSVTQPAMQALRDGGFMTMSGPADLGGAQLSHAAWLEVLEELGRNDAPSGWCMQALTSHAGLFGSLLPDAAAQHLYGADEPPQIAGMPAPRGKAERTDGGYIFEGKHQFASGSGFANYFTAGAIVMADGKPVMAANGVPEMIAVVLPDDKVERLGNWNVEGMEATASIDYEVERQFVPGDYVLSTNPWPLEQYRGSDLWREGAEVLGPVGHSPIALGMGHRALQEIAALTPTRKRVDANFPTVADQPLFQHGLALLDIELKAIRNYFYAHVEANERYVGEYGGPLAEAEVRKMQQTTRYLHDVCIRCVDFAYEWSGSAGLRKGHVIGRLFRNMHAINQHVVIDRNILIGAAPFVRDELAAGLSD